MEVPNVQLTAEGRALFQEGITLIFSKWYALQLAVQNEWGGPHSLQKAHNFASRVFNFFVQPNQNEPIYIDDLEKLLDEGMDTFNTTADDGSIEEVAEQLMIMHEECLEGNYQSIQKLKEVKTVPIPDVRQSEDDSDEDEDVNLGNDDASSMMVDSNPVLVAKGESTQEMVEADDGWVTVSSKKGKGKGKGKGRKN